MRNCGCVPQPLAKLFTKIGRSLGLAHGPQFAKPLLLWYENYSFSRRWASRLIPNTETFSALQNQSRALVAGLWLGITRLSFSVLNRIPLLILEYVRIALLISVTVTCSHWHCLWMGTHACEQDQWVHLKTGMLRAPGLGMGRYGNTSFCSREKIWFWHLDLHTTQSIAEIAQAMWFPRIENTKNKISLITETFVVGFH